MAIQDWSKEPDLNELNKKYEGSPDGEIRALAEYVELLQAYSQGPQRKDFKSDREFKEAIAKFSQKDSFFGDRIPGAPIGAGALFGIDTRMPNAASDPANVVTPAERKKQLQEKLKKAQADLQKKKKENPELSSKIEAEKKQKETETRQKEQQTTADKKLSDFGSIAFRTVREVGVPKRPGETRKLPVTKNVTYQQWLLEWDDKANATNPNYDPDFIADFRIFAGQVLGLNPQRIDDGSLFEIWKNLGAYAIEKSKETGKAFDPLNETSIEDFKSWESKELLDSPQAKQLRADTISKLQSFYFRNGLGYTNSEMEESVNKILKGELSYDEYVNSKRQILAQQYPTWAKAIEGGTDVRSLADSYISKMADVLEVDADGIDLRDNLIQKAIQTKTEDGKFTTQSLRDFEITLRNDPRWEKTSNARQEITNMATFVLQKFGKR